MRLLNTLLAESDELTRAERTRWALRHLRDRDKPGLFRQQLLELAREEVAIIVGRHSLDVGLREIAGTVPDVGMHADLRNWSKRRERGRRGSCYDPRLHALVHGDHGQPDAELLVRLQDLRSDLVARGDRLFGFEVT